MILRSKCPKLSNKIIQKGLAAGVVELVGKLGFEPVDAGPLKNARLLEPFAMVWIDHAAGGTSPSRW